MAVSNTNVGLRSQIADNCLVNETTNLSLKSIMVGGVTVNGILNTFANNDNAGPVGEFEIIGGSNNPLQSTAGSDITSSNISAITTAPFHMSHAIGGDHVAGGGPGR